MCEIIFDTFICGHYHYEIVRCKDGERLRYSDDDARKCYMRNLDPQLGTAICPTPLGKTCGKGHCTIAVYGAPAGACGALGCRKVTEPFQTVKFGGSQQGFIQYPGHLADSQDGRGMEAHFNRDGKWICQRII